MSDTTERPAQNGDHASQPGGAQSSVGTPLDVGGRLPDGDRRPRRPVRFGSGSDRGADGRDADQVRELLLGAVEQAVAADSLESLARTVCDRLADAELYRFARIDEPAAGNDRLATRTTAGQPTVGPDEAASTTADSSSRSATRSTTSSTDQSTTSSTDQSTTSSTIRSVSRRAVRTGEPQSTSVVTAGTMVPDGRPSVGRGASQRDDLAVAAVPLVHDGTVFGVLTVGATGAEFDDRERRDLAVLGETVGFVISALRTRQLLHAQAVSELEFELAGGESFLCRTAADLGCSLTVDGYVATNDGDWLLYVFVSGTNAASFPDAVDAEDCVRSVKRIGGDDDGVFVGLRAETPLLDTIAATGGTVTTATMRQGGGRIAVEVPQSVDVRSLVGQVRSHYPDATLRSRTNHDRPVENAVWLSDDRRPDLTDRQREVLEACYRAGYFEWPRENTAEDVAELLGIAAPTLHAHLRKAERALLTAFLGPRDDHRDRYDRNRHNTTNDRDAPDDHDRANDRSADRDGYSGHDCVPGP